MNKERENYNTSLIILLIIMCMFVILFCCYLIYRQNLILIKESENTVDINPNRFKDRKHTQIIYGSGKTKLDKIKLLQDGDLCIEINGEEPLCVGTDKPVYAFLDENEEQSNVYVITENGMVTKIAFNDSLSIKVEEKYHQLQDIIRIYESEDGKTIFVDNNSKEYEV